MFVIHYNLILNITYKGHIMKVKTIDVEATEEEIKEVFNYYNVSTLFEVLEFDECYSKVSLTLEQIKWLDYDNIAYWDDGELL